MSEPVTTVDYVRAAIGGDAIKAKDIFNQLMSPKVVDAVDTARNEVAQNYFGQQQPAEEPVNDQSETDETEIEASSEENSESSETDTEKEEPENENA